MKNNVKYNYKHNKKHNKIFATMLAGTMVATLISGNYTVANEADASDIVERLDEESVELPDGIDANALLDEYVEYLHEESAFFDAGISEEDNVDLYNEYQYTDGDDETDIINVSIMGDSVSSFYEYSNYGLDGCFYMSQEQYAGLREQTVSEKGELEKELEIVKADREKNIEDKILAEETKGEYQKELEAIIAKEEEATDEELERKAELEGLISDIDIAISEYEANIKLADDKLNGTESTPSIKQQIDDKQTMIEYLDGKVKMPVESTWWMRLVASREWTLDSNESLGGSCVAWNKQGSVSKTMSSNARINALALNGTPDKIIVFGGLNDVLSQDIIIGKYKKNTVKYDSVDNFADAYYTMLVRMQKKYKDAEIICIIPYDTVFSHIGDAAPALKANTQLVHDNIIAICNDLDVKYVDIKDANIIDFNKHFCSDYIHLNEEGMRVLYEYTEEVLEENHGFVEKDGGYRYYDENSNRVVNAFVTVKDKTYYINQEGFRVDDKFETIEGKLYYFDKDGARLEQEQGIVSIKGKKYFILSDYSLACSMFVGYEGKTYFCQEDGTILNTPGFVYLNDLEYFVNDDSSIAIEQFIIANGKKYYMDKDGHKTKDKRIDTKDKKIYFADKDGVIINDEFFCDGTYTYYLQYDGSAMTDRLTYHPDGEHIIYFDDKGHEVFSDFSHVKKSISGDKVDDYCFFDVYGYMYVDVITYDKKGEKLYYANPYGVLEVGKWFQFSDTVKWADGTECDGIAGGYGYAKADGTLLTNEYTYNWNGEYCYLQGNGVMIIVNAPN